MIANDFIGHHSNLWVWAGIVFLRTGVFVLRWHGLQVLVPSRAARGWCLSLRRIPPVLFVFVPIPRFDNTALPISVFSWLTILGDCRGLQAAVSTQASDHSASDLGAWKKPPAPRTTHANTPKPTMAMAKSAFSLIPKLSHS